MINILTMLYIGWETDDHIHGSYMRDFGCKSQVERFWHIFLECYLTTLLIPDFYKSEVFNEALLLPFTSAAHEIYRLATSMNE